MTGVWLRKCMLMQSKTRSLKPRKAHGLNAIDKEQAVNGTGRNKLRTYRLIKRTYKTEPYCLTRLPPKHRSAFAKFRCGVAPIRIETGRYEGLELKIVFAQSVKMISRMRLILFYITYLDTYLDTTEHLSPFGLSSGSIIVSTLFSDFRCQKFSVRIQLKSFNVAII